MEAALSGGSIKKVKSHHSGLPQRHGATPKLPLLSYSERKTLKGSRLFAAAQVIAQLLGKKKEGVLYPRG